MSVLRRQVQGAEGKVDAVVSATACVHGRLPAAPPRRALGVEASARGLVRGRPRGRLFLVLITILVFFVVLSTDLLLTEKKGTSNVRKKNRPRRARDKRDCDAEMPPSEEVAMVEEKSPTRAGALRALRVQVGGGL